MQIVRLCSVYSKTKLRNAAWSEAAWFLGSLMEEEDDPWLFDV